MINFIFGFWTGVIIAEAILLAAILVDNHGQR